MPQRSVKEQLVEAAAHVLFEKGFYASSVNDIVEAADIPKGSFYNHFESKEALALEVVQRYAATYETESLRVGPGAPLKRLRQHFEAMIERTEARGLELGCLVGNFSTDIAVHSPMIRTFIKGAFTQWSGAVSACLAQAQATGHLDKHIDVDSLGVALVNAYEGAVACAKVNGHRGPLDAFLSMLDLLLGSKRR